MSTSLPSPALRDPAWRGRVFWVGAAAVLLAPMLVATEFKPWVLVEPDNLNVTLPFLGDFLPPKVDGEFLALVAREARRPTCRSRRRRRSFTPAASPAGWRPASSLW